MSSTDHTPTPSAQGTQGWTMVSPQLRAMRRTLVFALCGLLLIVLVVVAFASRVWLVLAVGLPVLVFAMVLTLRAIDRNYASWGYAERAEDLLVRRGVLFHRLVVVPYGRMQLVDVTVGPIERRFDIAAVRLHTASAGTDARIRGLSPQEAARLRDRLAALGEARSAGL